MRTVSVVGARPQFIKLAPVSRAMAEFGSQSIHDTIVHTGQHYDATMSRIFFDELKIPEPAVDLAIGSGLHGEQTAKMLTAIEDVLLKIKPDLVITYGDTNSTIGASLAAAKLNYPVAHIEAGLRSYDRTMPEEVNRIVTDHISDLLFAPTRTAVDNLHLENLGSRTFLTGDVMLDAVIFNERLSESASSIVTQYKLHDRPYAVATLHRAANTDSEKLQVILEAMNEIAAADLTVVFPVHPRTAARMRQVCPEWVPHSNLQLIEPIGYLDMIQLLANARIALTDSGGLQKEAFFLGTPCITLREETEWPETVQAGANCLVGADHDRLLSEVSRCLLENRDRKEVRQSAHDMFGHGNAAREIVQRMIEFNCK